MDAVLVGVSQRGIMCRVAGLEERTECIHESRQSLHRPRRLSDDTFSGGAKKSGRFVRPFVGVGKLHEANDGKRAERLMRETPTSTFAPGGPVWVRKGHRWLAFSRDEALKKRKSSWTETHFKGEAK